MKKQIILASIVALLEIGHAQVWTTGFSPGQETTPGRVGVGTNLPAFKLDVLTADTDGGLRIRQTNGAVKGGAHLYLDNNDGHNWSLISTGGPNNIGKNHFVIYDLSHSPIKPRFFISGTGGNVGIGTTVTDYDTKLNVENNTSATLPQWGAKINVLQTTAIPPAGAHNDRIALEANASTNYIHEAIMYGVIGNSSYGLYNTGGKFKAFNVYGFNNGKCIGVDATAIGSQNAYGVYATATSGASTNWAGYFVGNVYSTGSFIASDKKLKREINPVSNMMERIMKLKPSTYNYKTEEFKEMQLPEGNQIGLIAQELEEVFP